LLLAPRRDGAITIGDTHAFDAPGDFGIDDEAHCYLEREAEAAFGAPLPAVAHRWEGAYLRRCDGRDWVWREAGDPLDERTDVGTVIDEAAAVEIERRIEAAVDAGARLLAGGHRRGALIEPCVLDHVRPEMAIVAMETFGPVASILRVRDADEALELANSTSYGLSAGVVTGELELALRCARELRCGTVNIDEVPGFRTELTPFGGVGDSGLGVKEGVREMIRALTVGKLVSYPW
jgi:phosphonoacetaldehyde dehydrogenase